ncbi:hypothetical protein BVG79_00599 [Ketogulonicigenium robustum]|uniref:Uncharacterized protein n=1 Tax=Ketogulonicigenium robustum TaxID=92947 RepID=A0A1W6NXN9_9RHOB|nr:hypothetical protein [Ketogulonicigenium robustum]ARO13951.1 hypothetical protein BVG79_00599 [Ketogulonicigenium robustum]
MQIAFFAGLNATDDEKVLRSLMRNDEGLAKHGIRAPAMRHYRRSLREIVESRLSGQDVTTLGYLVTNQFAKETPNLQRIALSNPAFLAAPRHMFADGIALPEAGARLQVLQAIFPDDEIEVFVALRNPASFVNTMMQALGDTDVRGYLGGYDIMGLRWSQVLRRLKDSVPSIKLTVWANEDSALVWGTIIRAILGIADNDPIFGDFDLLSDLLLPEGQGLLRQRLRQDVPVGHAARVALAADLLPQYEDPTLTWDSIDLTGWSERAVEGMTLTYEEDLDVIAEMEDITFIRP